LSSSRKSSSSLNYLLLVLVNPFPPFSCFLLNFDFEYYYCPLVDYFDLPPPIIIVYDYCNEELTLELSRMLLLSASESYRVRCLKPPAPCLGLSFRGFSLSVMARDRNSVMTSSGSRLISEVWEGICSWVLLQWAVEER
jgi:hypothetical protein